MMRKPAVLLLFILVSGCATGVDYKTLDRHVATEKCDEATKYVLEKEENYGSRGRLLFLLDAASIHMYCGEYEKSNAFFQEADGLAQDLWTKSITSEGASFLINDYTIPYAGEDFEKALINMFSAINYSVLGQYDEALVECRRLNSKLTELNDKYEEKNVYKEDAFGRYLSGMIYEAEGAGKLENIDSAFIDYNKAVDVYKDYAAKYHTAVPSVLVEDYLRIAEAADRLREAKAKVRPAKDMQWLDHREVRRLGKIVLIHLNGKAPVKEEDKVVASTPSGPVPIAFPRFVATPPRCRAGEMVVESAKGILRTRLELVEDIASIAMKNLDDRKGRVVAKAIARAAVKQAAINAAAKEADNKRMRELTRFGLNILNLALERADTRSWRTLPAEINMARVYVPPGWYDVSARVCGINRFTVDSVFVKAGQTRFLFLQTVY